MNLDLAKKLISMIFCLKINEQSIWLFLIIFQSFINLSVEK